MIRLIQAVVLLALLAMPARVGAQEQGSTFLERLIEDRLSTAGTEVRIDGFRGVLSSQASLDKLTIADARGVWFTLRDARLQWSRAALLQGRLQVAELSAAHIDVPRLPQGGGGLTPDNAAARGFALPDLPIAIEIGKIRAGRITLGEPVLGQAADLSAEGSLSLTDGAGEAALAVTRNDAEARLAFEARYLDDTRELTLDLDLREAEDGLLAALLKLPGAPALSLRAAGRGPLSDFAADVDLATAGETRLAGEVRLFTPADAATGQAFAADLAGDLRPLFPEAFRTFFGQATRLALDGRADAESGLRVSRLAIRSAAMDLSGNLHLGPNGWPRAFELSGRIGGEGAVRLPVPGAATQVDTARMTASYDAARGEAWQAVLAVTGLQRNGTLTLDKMRLTGQGKLRHDDGALLEGTISAETAGLALADTALRQAVGSEPAGRLGFAYRPQAPLLIDHLTAESAGLRLSAQGRIGSPADGLPVSGSAEMTATDLSRFAAAAGRALAGQGTARISGARLAAGRRVRCRTVRQD